MKSHRHILSKRDQQMHRERVKGQGHPIVADTETPAAKPIAFAPTLLKNITDKARRRVLRAASRLAWWGKK